MDESESNAATVAEIQGLYGPFTFPERLLQKIWADGAFDRTQLCAADGRRVRVRHPGSWNRLAGPDFKDARLQLGDAAECVGDVELHLHAEDWAAHGHAADPAYRRVKLHVVLFPPRPEHVTRDGEGRPIPVLALLPWLQHDLEEFAAQAAVESLANRAEDRVREQILSLPLPRRWEKLRSHAQRRWRQKVYFAGLRIAKLGWDEAATRPLWKSWVTVTIARRCCGWRPASRGPRGATSMSGSSRRWRNRNGGIMRVRGRPTTRSGGCGNTADGCRPYRIGRNGWLPWAPCSRDPMTWRSPRRRCGGANTCAAGANGLGRKYAATGSAGRGGTR
ncbi:MAG: DUF2851 family protein [Opitutales bacterium]